MACPQCGSWSVRADRSLAGRMVCGRCGTPLQGVQRQGGRSTRPQLVRRRLPQLGRGSWRWWLLGLVGAAALLAALTPESRVPQPADSPPDRAQHRWQ